MNNPPTVRRISDINSMDDVIRKGVRAQLDRADISDCKECPKPIWFTAFFDGTGNNYDADGVGGRGGSTDASKVKYSNISKLWQFAHGNSTDYPRTIGRYIEGVGTPCPKVKDSGKGIDNALGMAAARLGEARINWMLDELKKHADNHMPFVSQINIAVFGFSRGATQARAFVRMLTDKLAENSGGRLWWQQKNAKDMRPEVVVYFLGILDTVSSTGYGGSRLESSAPYALPVAGTILLGPAGTIIGTVGGGTLISVDKGGHAEWAQDLRIPDYVRRCVHFVASHEVREKFPSDSVREDQVLPSNCVEVFYPGMHSDVGGGYAYEYQEKRSNELSRVALNNLFIEGWKAGVPFKSPKDVMKSAGSMFEISKHLESMWNVYMGQGGVIGVGSAPKSDRLETNIIWHMNRYYQWRASRRRRLRDKRLKPPGGVDPYMAITDREWNADIELLARARGGYLTRSVDAHEQAIFDAYKGDWIAGLGGEAREAFDLFFDRYVHDSIAGFKNQMADGGVGFAEASRWSVNRRIFMGKRGDKFLYWTYQGKSPEKAGTQTAMLEKSPLPAEADTSTSVA